MDEYETTDLCLMAVLANFGYHPKRMERATSNPRQVVSTYDLTLEVEETINKFWRGELLVEPSKFFGTLSMVKTRIYNCLGRSNYGSIR